MSKWLNSMKRKNDVSAWLKSLRRERNSIANVHDVLQQLEKWISTAELTMMQIFFFISLRYEKDNIRNKIHEKFWKRAYYTKRIIKKTECRKRKTERIRKNENKDEKHDFSDHVEVWIFFRSRTYWKIFIRFNSRIWNFFSIQKWTWLQWSVCRFRCNQFAELSVK
jgi:hypothetical protein